MTTEEVIEKTAKSEMAQFFGITVETVEKGRAVITMPVTSKVHQYIGIMNGGVNLLLAETAAALGAIATSDLEKVTPVGVEINANHLRAVSKGVLRVEAKVITHGRTMSIWQIEIRDERNRLTCLSRCTIALRKGAATPANEQ